MSRITIGQRLLIALLALVFASCASMSQTAKENPKAILGGMGGAAGGGLIAAAAGANPGWIAFSVLAGGLVGGAIGNRLPQPRVTGTAPTRGTGRSRRPLSSSRRISPEGCDTQLRLGRRARRSAAPHA